MPGSSGIAAQPDAIDVTDKRLPVAVDMLLDCQRHDFEIPLQLLGCQSHFAYWSFWTFQMPPFLAPLWVTDESCTGELKAKAGALESCD
jgi:hypothetical protein